MNDHRFRTYRDEVIKQGIVSVEKVEKRPAQREGALEGFALCSKIENLDDFEAILGLRHQEETRMRGEKIAADNYWKYRYATLQIEHVFERMRVVENYGDTFSARAAIQVGLIRRKLSGQQPDL